MMEIIGVNDFVPEEIELEEYVGRIDSVIGEDLNTLSRRIPR